MKETELSKETIENIESGVPYGFLQNLDDIKPITESTLTISASNFKQGIKESRRERRERERKQLKKK